MRVDAEEILEIVEHFGNLADPRSHINRKHLLGDLIVICVCGVLAGCDGPISIGQWAQVKRDWLAEHLELPGGIPSHDTLARLLMALCPASFQACFTQWVLALVQRKERELSAAQEENPSTILQRHIAIDGKTLRRSHDRRKGLGAMHLVSAWAVDCGISLGQLATEAKSNEITAIPELLKQIDTKKAIVTIDAAGCQKEIAEKIVAGGGDYCLALKGNQGNLHADVLDRLERLMSDGFKGCKVEIHKSAEEKRHGRKDRHEYYHLDAPPDLFGKEKWAKLKTIGAAVRYSTRGAKENVEFRYYICSFKRDVNLFAKTVRGHWAIENTLHWCLDVTFREDDSRIRQRNLTNNMAWLRRFAISLFKQVNDKKSIAMRRRACGWDDDYLAQVVFGKRT
jgi:predicted transposase YbfD/YdcC